MKVVINAAGLEICYSEVIYFVHACASFIRYHQCVHAFLHRKLRRQLAPLPHCQLCHCYHASTWLYLIVLNSITLYHGSTWLYLTLLNSITLYHGSTWFHLTLLHLTLLHLTLMNRDKDVKTGTDEQEHRTGRGTRTNTERQSDKDRRIGRGKGTEEQGQQQGQGCIDRERVQWIVTGTVTGTQVQRERDSETLSKICFKH